MKNKLTVEQSSNTQQAPVLDIGTTKREHLLTRAEVAKMLSVCGHSVARRTRDGVLKAIVFNRRMIRYRQSDVSAYIQSASAK